VAKERKTAVVKSDVRGFEQISVNKGKARNRSSNATHRAPGAHTDKRKRKRKKEKKKKKKNKDVSEYLPGGDYQNDGHVSAVVASCRLLIGFLVLGLVRMFLSGRKFERRNSPGRAGGWAAKEIFVM
jgi:hypothetical protein